MLRNWIEQPLLKMEEIMARLDAVEELAKMPFFAKN
jgi:DNA mismatch repair ATPase MutS